MEGVKRFFYFILGFIGLFMVGITIVIILLQYNTEMNLPLTIFCAISWILFFIAVFQTLLPEVDYNYDVNQKSMNESKESETENKD